MRSSLVVLLAALASYAESSSRNHFPSSYASSIFDRAADDQPYVYETAYFSAYIDNFNFNGPTSAATYQQRYLINDTYWKGPGYPIFFYCGNEGFIELFAQNTGFMWDIAPDFGALLVFAEHRYYGTSLPFGNSSYITNNTAFLSSEQALADYAYLLWSLKTNLSATDSPVVSFGGSYGGMLAAWFRMKYPTTTVGAIAASAPILQIPGIMQPGEYWGTITADYGKANSAAPAAIYAAWQAMVDYGNSADGLSFMTDAFHLCSPLQSQDDVQNAIGWLESAIGFSAMADYPYPASFLGPMPAWPVSVQAAVFKENMTSAELIEAMYAGIATVFYNYTGQAGDCFDINSQGPPDIQGDGWGIQCCHEVAQPIGTYGPPNDFLPPSPFDLNAFIAGCQEQFDGLTPRPYWIARQYGGLDLHGASNIVFTNGNLDPWISGGITTNRTYAPSLIAYVIDQGAHHLDLRAANPADPPSVIEARAIEVAAIKSWIAEASL